MVSFVCAGAVGCGAVAGLAGLSHGPVARITLHVPDTLFVKDTAAVFADSIDKDGKDPTGDTTVTWRTSDPDVISIDLTTPPPLPTPRLAG
jgi:hypothetical protein